MSTIARHRNPADDSGLLDMVIEKIDEVLPVVEKIARELHRSGLTPTAGFNLSKQRRAREAFEEMTDETREDLREEFRAEP